MTPRRWKNIGAWTMAMVLGLAGLLWLAEYLDRGAVMRPVRRLADKLDIRIPRPTLTPSEEAEARAMAKAWKQECLDKFPELRVIPRPVPEAENGFWQLLQLDNQPPVSKELAKLLVGLKTGYPPDVAARLLAEHQSQIEHIEHIADLPERSSMNLAGYDGFLRAAPIKQAMEILLLKACLAAEARNEAEALQSVRRARNLSAHLSEVETPTLLSLTVAELGQRALHDLVLTKILPKLGPECDLAAWKGVMADPAQGTPLHFAKVFRGEWQVGADHFAFFMIASEDKLGLIADGKGHAMAYSAWLAGLTKQFMSTKSWPDYRPVDWKKTFVHLPKEQAQFMSIVSIGHESWIENFQGVARLNAQHQAALELLMLEKAGKTLTADSVRDITHDPLGSGPFIFDPVKRTLDAPAGFTRKPGQTLSLPW